MLRLKALRSLATAVAATAVGVLIGQYPLAVVAAMTLIASVAVSAWSFAGEESRVASLMSKSEAGKGHQPTPTRSVADVVKVLKPLPLGIAIVYGVSRLAPSAGIQPGILLGGLNGLLLGLGFSRARLATSVVRWEKRLGVGALYPRRGLLEGDGPLYTYRENACGADHVRRLQRMADGG